MVKLHTVSHKKPKRSNFEYILYKEKSHHNFIIELPDNGHVFSCPRAKLSKYIYQIKEKSDWIELWDNEFIKYDSDRIFHLKYILNDFKSFYISIKIKNIEYTNYIKEKIKEKDFKNSDDFQIIMNEGSLVLNMKAIMPPIGVIIEKNTKDNYSRVCRLFCKMNNEFYKFPYGNSYNYGRMCFGATTVNNSEKSENFLLRFITSQFNSDLGFHLKYSPTETILFDINQIEEKIEQNEEKPTLGLHLIDILYYLSSLNIKQFKNLDFRKFFLKLEKDPLNLTNLTN